MRLFFCCSAHTVFGSPSPGHGKEDRCIVLPTGTNKAPGIHERQWPGRAFGSVCWVYHKLYLSQAWDGGYAVKMAVLRGLWAAGAVPLAGAALFV